MHARPNSSVRHGLTRLSISIVALLIFNCAHSQPLRLVVPIGHSEMIKDYKISNNGRFLVTAARDQTVKLWDIKSGYLLQTFNTEDIDVRNIAISNNNKMLAILDVARFCRLYDIASGGLLSSFELDRVDLSQGVVPLVKFMFSPNDKSLIAATDKFIREYNIGSKSLSTLAPSGIDVSIATAIVLNSTIIPNPYDKDLRLTVTEKKSIDGRTWRLIDFGIGATFCKLSASGKKAIVNHYGHLILFNFGQKTSRVPFNDEIINPSGGYYAYNAIFSENENKVLVLEGDGIIKIWDANSGTRLCQLGKKLANPGKYVYYPLTRPATFFDNEKKVIIVSDANELEIFDCTTGQRIGSLGKNKEEVWSIQLCANNQKVVATFRDGGIKVWDLAQQGVALFNFSQTVGNIESADFLPREGEIRVKGKSTQMSFFDFKNCEIIPVKSPEDMLEHLDEKFATTELIDEVELPGADVKNLYKILQDTLVKLDEGNGNDLYFNLIRKKYFANPSGKKQVIYEFLSGNKISELQNCVGELVAVMNPAKTLLCGKAENVSGVWDIKTGAFLFKIEDIKDPEEAKFINGGKKILYRKSNNNFCICDIQSKKCDAEFNLSPGNGQNLFDFDTDPSGSKILISRDKQVEVWNLESRTQLKKFPFDATMARFSKDGTAINILTGNKLIVIDVSTLAQRSELALSSSPNYVDMSYDNRYALTVNNAIMQLWDITKGKQMAGYTVLNEEDYLARTPQGYYKCTPAAARMLHYVAPDLSVVSFAQMDIKYNRPDIVLQATGSQDTALIKLYKRAYEQRIKRLEVDTSKFKEIYTAPEMSFVNADSIDRKQTGTSLKLHLTARDTVFNLTRFNIWINETPLFGQRGWPLTKRSNKFDTTIIVKLNEGINRVEAAVTNENGIESFRQPLELTYTGAQKKNQKVYFVGIGINEFQQAGHNLKYSSKDIKDLAAKFKAKYGNSLEIDTLLNSSVTAARIRALKSKLLATDVDDRVIIAYSGHGLLSDSLDYYLSTYDVDFNSPSGKGLPYHELENLMDGIAARKKLLLVDACHSGEFNKDDYTPGADDPGNTNDTNKGKTKPKHNQAKETFELMQTLFNNVAKGTGAIILAAASGTEFAMEDHKLSNGIFSSAILDAMDKKKTITVSELKKLIHDKVTLISNGRQKPTSRNEPIGVDWTVW